MKRLIIIGAGGFGREVLGYALDIGRTDRDWEVYGFINDDLNALNTYNVGFPIVGTIKDYEPESNDVFICAIGDSKDRLRICRELKSRGAKFICLIHPTAYIGQRVELGEGLIMAPKSMIGPDVIVGNFVVINFSSAFGHDSRAEDGCTLSSFCDVTGYAYLEEGVFLGTHTSILPHVKVGRYAKIGAGSIIMKNVCERALMYALPAKRLY